MTLNSYVLQAAFVEALFGFGLVQTYIIYSPVYFDPDLKSVVDSYKPCSSETTCYALCEEQASPGCQFDSAEETCFLLASPSEYSPVATQDHTEEVHLRLVPGEASEWTLWTSCSQTCGPGKSTRTRLCVDPKPHQSGQQCSDLLTESVDCNSSDPCPVDGQWGSWTSQGFSDSHCSSGHSLFLATTKYTRSCDSPAPAHGGTDCPDTDEVEKYSCRMENDAPCPCHDSSYATSSSVLSNHPTYAASYAFDKVEIREERYFWHSDSTIDGEGKSWLQIDLQAPTTVYRIAIMDRKDGPGLQRPVPFLQLHSYEARVGNQVTTGGAKVIDYNTKCGNTMPSTEQPHRNYMFECPLGIPGQYVTIQKRGSGSVHVNEIYIDNRSSIPSREDLFYKMKCFWYGSTVHGQDLVTGFAVADIWECQDACLQRTECGEFLYPAPGRCYSKRDVPAEQHTLCAHCISGPPSC